MTSATQSLEELLAFVQDRFGLWVVLVVGALLLLWALLPFAILGIKPILTQIADEAAESLVVLKAIEGRLAMMAAQRPVDADLATAESAGVDDPSSPPILGNGTQASAVEVPESPLGSFVDSGAELIELWAESDGGEVHASGREIPKENGAAVGEGRHETVAHEAVGLSGGSAVTGSMHPVGTSRVSTPLPTTEADGDRTGPLLAAGVVAAFAAALVALGQLTGPEDEG